MGKEYALISNLDTIQKVLELDQDPATIKKVIINLKDLHLPESVDNVEEWVKDRSSKLNAEAKKLL
jgi:hypothetical protein